MKTLLILFTAMLLSFTAFSQSNFRYGSNDIISSYDLSELTGADTTIYGYVQDYGEGPGFGITFVWTGVTGTGTVDIMVGSDATNWHQYDINNNFQFSLTGATGTEAFASGFTKIEFLLFAVKITKGTLSAGTFSSNLRLKK